MKKTRSSTLSVSIGIILAIAGCNGANQPDSGEGDANTLSGSVKIDGSSTVYPVSEAVAEDFKSVEPDVQVTVGSSGSGAGFKKFARGETDISDASRAIKSNEKDACAKNGIDFIELTVAYDGLSIIVNKDNDWIESITVEMLKKMWEPEAEGKITRWNQLNPNWPDKEIHLLGPSTAHGTYDYFTEEIMGESGASRSDYTACADYNVLVQGITNDKFALGYVGLAYYEANKDKLGLVAVDGGTGPVLPATATVKDGSYAPLSRKLFIYVKKEQPSNPALTAYVNYYLENAGALATEVGYIALPDEAYKKQKNDFNAFIN